MKLRPPFRPLRPPIRPLRVAPKPQSKRKPPLTVCIAAISERHVRPVIIGISDRMLTAGDIEFERPSAKFGRFGPSIVVMIAGDFSIQDEICQRTVHGKSAGFSSVSEAVSAYYAEVSSYNVRLAERSVLSPLGLNMESFIARQREFSPKFVDQVKYEIRTRSLRSTSPRSSREWMRKAATYTRLTLMVCHSAMIQLASRQLEAVRDTLNLNSC